MVTSEGTVQIASENLDGHEPSVMENIQSVSVVIPVYNEAESLPMLHEALHQALDSLTFPWEAKFEYIK